METRFKTALTALAVFCVLAFWMESATAGNSVTVRPQSLSGLFGVKAEDTSLLGKKIDVEFGPGPVFRGQKTDNGRLWTSFYYSGSALEPKDADVKIRPDLYGFQLGLDIPKTKTVCSNYFMNIGRSNTDFDSDARSKVNHYQFGFGKRIDWGMGYIGYTSSLTYDDYKIRDRISNKQHSGDGLQANISGEAALCWGGDTWKFRPFYGLQYDFLYHGRLGKAGSAFMSDSNDHSLQQFIGLRFTKSFFYSIDWQLRASWVHQMLGHTPPFFSTRFSSISATGVPTPAVPFFGGDVGRDWAWLGTGVQFDFHHWYLFFDYDLLVNGRQNSHIASMLICLTW